MAFSATITKTGVSSCGHIVLAVTGAVTATEEVHLDDILASLSAAEKRQFLQTWLKIYAIGKTKAQLNSAATAGIPVSIG